MTTTADDMVAHVYDITYGTVRPGVDNLVVIDDSIVRGTTLKQSILRMLDRLEPKRIVVVSSAPQIRYPDCYGIDMAKMGDLAAFRAAIALLKETKQENIIDDVYDRAAPWWACPWPNKRMW
jgi:amidophosphoribosyltransferase